MKLTQQQQCNILAVAIFVLGMLLTVILFL